jgi:hypothetical protein
LDTKLTVGSELDTTLIWYWLNGFIIPLGVHQKVLLVGLVATKEEVRVW